MIRYLVNRITSGVHSYTFKRFSSCFFVLMSVKLKEIKAHLQFYCKVFIKETEPQLALTCGTLSRLDDEKASRGKDNNFRVCRQNKSRRCLDLHYYSVAWTEITGHRVSNLPTRGLYL